MSVLLGKRLAKYRKRKGLSQEQLAFELNISRQAVSKWERGESSPDTQNLIELSNLYNVSLDDLLNKDPEEVFDEKINSESEFNTNNETTKSEEETEDNISSDSSFASTNEDSKKHDYVHVGFDGIHVLDADGEEVHIDKNGIRVKSNEDSFTSEIFSQKIQNKIKIIPIWMRLIEPILLLVVATIYLILGFTLPNNDGWSIYWTLFLCPIIIQSVIKAIYYKYISKFNITIAITFIYTFVGMYLGLWHPTWIIFLAIPIFYSIFTPLDKYLFTKRSMKNSNVIDLEDID